MHFLHVKKAIFVLSLTTDVSLLHFLHNLNQHLLSTHLHNLNLRVMDELMKGALVRLIEYRSMVHSFIFTWESIPNNNIIFKLTILLPHCFSGRDIIE